MEAVMLKLIPVLSVLLAVSIVACDTVPTEKHEAVENNVYCSQNVVEIDFGSVIVGESKVRYIVISANVVSEEEGGVSTTVTCQDKDLSITDILGETTTGEQQIDLDAGEQISVYLKFTPTSAGTKSGKLEIGSDCTDVTLKGIGVLSTGWSIDRVPGGPDLYDIWGDPLSTYACGDMGTVMMKIEYSGPWILMEDTGIAPVPLHSVWGFQSNPVWFVGGNCDFGITYASAWSYYEPSDTWTEVFDGNMLDCYGSAWGSSPVDIYFGGASISGMFPNASHWYGDERSDFILGMEYDLVSGIFGSGPEDIWAVQANPYDSLYHYDGAKWKGTKDAFMTSALYDVWVASGGEACAVGADGAIYYYNGSAWADYTIESSSDTLFGVWGKSYDDIYAVGTNAGIWHWDGNIWQQESAPAEVTGTLYGVWANSTEVYAVGAGGVIIVKREDVMAGGGS